MRVELGRLDKIRNRKKHKKIVLIGGCFDVIHVGHLNFLKIVKKFGDILVVAVASDKRVQEKKGLGRPINNEKERAKVIESIKGVDYVVITPYKIEKVKFPTFEIIKLLKPDYFVTSDESWNLYLKDVNKVSPNTEIKFVTVSKRKINSTTSVIKRVLTKNAIPDFV